MKLEFEKVSKSYGKTKALIGFSATLEPGVYALLGPNGSGKSTLMNILTDNLKADEGRITFDGEDVLKLGGRFREKLGFMPQYPGMYGSFTAESFLWYVAELKAVPREKAKKDIAEVLEAVELSDAAGKRISSFSGGMKQRLALAQAVLGDPAVLVLDEPTAGLDPKQRIAVRNYISKIAFNKIVIIATHVVSDIEFIARDVIMLKKGVIVDNAPPAELISRIEGRVWRVPAAPNEVQALQSRFTVTNIQKDDRGVSLRILADEAPAPEAEPVAPSLEDYYLHVFGEAST
ncbi:MAG: ATP-binding cassette domain-containing protein [Clostridia bacterium]|nr:ATP-binding cassette domain-containing protein [Clostridia bacterium]